MHDRMAQLAGKIAPQLRDDRRLQLARSRRKLRAGKVQHRERQRRLCQHAAGEWLAVQEGNRADDLMLSAGPGFVFGHGARRDGLGPVAKPRLTFEHNMKPSRVGLALLQHALACREAANADELLQRLALLQRQLGEKRHLLRGEPAD